MSYEPPSPPAYLPTAIVNTLNDSDPEQLREVATYAEALAEHKEREARLEESASQDEVEERPDDLPDDVPAKATITIKEINDNLLLLAVARRKFGDVEVQRASQLGRVASDTSNLVVLSEPCHTNREGNRLRSALL